MGAGSTELLLAEKTPGQDGGPGARAAPGPAGKHIIVQAVRGATGLADKRERSASGRQLCPLLRSPRVASAYGRLEGAACGGMAMRDRFLSRRTVRNCFPLGGTGLGRHFSLLGRNGVSSEYKISYRKTKQEKIVPQATFNTVKLNTRYVCELCGEYDLLAFSSFVYE